MHCVYQNRHEELIMLYFGFVLFESMDVVLNTDF
jgi:hypothetical protein